MRSAADAAPSFLYVPGLASAGSLFTLDEDESRYVARVVRAREGESLTASDGRGTLATLAVERVRPDVVVRVRSRESVAAPAGARLLCGAPEGERGDWLVEKLAELGVTEFVPVDTRRVRWPQTGRKDRWERLAVAALRQSRSAWRLEIGAAVPLAEALEGPHPATRWLAEPDGVPASGLPLSPDEPVEGAVGPSAGFSDEEHKLLQELGFVRVRLAAARLRTETAAVALAAHWAGRR